MARKLTYTIVRRPPAERISRKSRGRYARQSAIRDVLLALPPNKALLVPYDSFPGHAEAYLHMGKHGHRIQQYNSQRGIYIWLGGKDKLR